jgi:membrane-associated protease RseP (regulator of RpoE activity)
MTRSILATFLTALLSAALLSSALPASAAEPAKPDAMVDLSVAGLDLNAAVEALSAQSGAVFVVDVHPQQLGPDIRLTAVPLTKAIEILATAYGVCIDARPPVTVFRDCRTVFVRRGQKPLAAQKSTSGTTLLGVEISAGAPKDPSARLPGAVVLRVLPGSVASAVGLQPGDTILRFDGRIIGNPSELRDAVDAVQLGSQVSLEVLRNGRQESLTAQF